MNLVELKIHCLRNIHESHVLLNPHINFIYGNNGSGKTSFLEAIYLLSTGHSFRSREIASLITHEQDYLAVFGKTDDQQTISLQKKIKQPTLAKINQQSCVSNSELAAFLPCQVFYQDIFQIIDAGPGYRRSLLDWGVFHVEHEYLAIWKNYRRALKQRNALLKKQSSYQQIQPWDHILSETAEMLHQLRLKYFNTLQADFEKILNKVCSVNCDIDYYKGWDRRQEGVTLADVLKKTFASDSQRQFTHYGIQHADIIIENNNGKAKSIFSRGQQKVVLFALKLAQANVLKRHCIFLIDDLTAELDEMHVENIMTLLQQMPGQYFITVRNGDKLLKPHQSIESQTLLINDGMISI